jgi:hypothetical protein
MSRACGPRGFLFPMGHGLINLVGLLCFHAG